MTRERECLLASLDSLRETLSVHGVSFHTEPRLAYKMDGKVVAHVRGTGVWKRPTLALKHPVSLGPQKVGPPLGEMIQAHYALHLTLGAK